MNSNNTDPTQDDCSFTCFKLTAYIMSDNRELPIHLYYSYSVAMDMNETCAFNDCNKEGQGYYPTFVSDLNNVTEPVKCYYRPTYPRRAYLTTSGVKLLVEPCIFLSITILSYFFLFGVMTWCGLHMYFKRRRKSFRE